MINVKFKCFLCKYEEEEHSNKKKINYFICIKILEISRLKKREMI